MNNEEILRNMFNVICSNYIETLIIGIKEKENCFTYTIAVANFIAFLRERNIIVNLYTTFEDRIIDMVLREINNYLAR